MLKKEENQKQFGLMPYVTDKTGWEGGTEKGAHFSSTYADFEDRIKIIAGELDSTCFMRKICSIQNISSSALDIIDDTSFDASWGTETSEVAVSNSSVLSKSTIIVFTFIVFILL